MSALLCFLDTETTGVHPGRKVWEIGMIRREPDGEERETSFFVEVNLAKADPFGLTVGRFYERHPLGPVLSGATSYNPPTKSVLKTPYQAAQMVARWTHGTHIV